jgi:leucyl aminopeptidase
MKIAELLAPEPAAGAIPVTCIETKNWPEESHKLDRIESAAARAQGFAAQPGRILILTSKEGEISRILYGLGPNQGEADPFLAGRLARTLPKGLYRLEGDVRDLRLAALSWLLEAYSFDRYRKKQEQPARLACPPGLDREHLMAQAEAVYFARDLINTPAADMGPAELEAVAKTLARAHRAQARTLIDKALARDFPMVLAVGRAAAPARKPRLIELRWGKARDPKVTLVGKGVCFDTGGLDIKPAAGMLLMKKDMGGAANALALASLIMQAELPVRLRVLIPAVDNAISGDAFRPGDILRSRKGLTVEVGNTDAEGRLVLADALAYADEDAPDLLIDLATLTGAARVALGPDLPPFYTADDALAAELMRHAMAENDPLWRLPLWHPYERLIESKLADINNASESGFAGSIVAALFLKKFVERAKAHLHLDIFGWTPVASPGRPQGGEAQGIRAIFALIGSRYGK